MVCSHYSYRKAVQEHQGLLRAFVLFLAKFILSYFKTVCSYINIVIQHR